MKFKCEIDIKSIIEEMLEYLAYKFVKEEIDYRNYLYSFRSAIKENIKNLYGIDIKCVYKAKFSRKIFGLIIWLSDDEVILADFITPRKRKNIYEIILRKLESLRVSKVKVNYYLVLALDINSSLIPSKYYNRFKEINHIKFKIIRPKRKNLNNLLIIEPGEGDKAYNFVESILVSARESVMIIDKYINRKILNLFLDKIPTGVQIALVTGSTANLEKFRMVIDNFPEKADKIIIYMDDDIHDRFVIIDNNEIWCFGHSLKDLGKKLTIIYKIPEIHKNDLLGTILGRLAMYNTPKTN